MNILGIDSTSAKLSITLSIEEKIVASSSRGSGRKYMEMIIEDIDHTLGRAEIGIGDVEAIGVNRGPGDFTGTRIGISVVKTLGWVLNIPVYGINALDVLAHSITYTNRGIISDNITSGIKVMVLPCLDVRKNELYYSLYEIGDTASRDNGKIKAPDITFRDRTYSINAISGRMLAAASDFPESLDDNLDQAGSPGRRMVIIGGNCIVRYGSLLSETAAGRRGLLVDKKNTTPDRTSLDNCIRRAVKSGIPGERVDPVYVRDFIPFGN